MSTKRRLSAVPIIGDIVRLQAALRSRRRLRRRVNTLAHMLATGRYRLRWNLAERVDDAGRSRSPAHALFLQHNDPPSRAHRLAEFAPPQTVEITAPGSAEQPPDTPADVVLIRGDCTLLLSCDGRHILRLFPDPVPAERILENWQQLKGGLNIPDVEHLANTPRGYYGVREALITGTTLRESAPDQVLSGYRDLLSQCAKHAASADGQYGNEPEARALLDLPLPHWLQTALRERQQLLLPLLTEAPGLFCHADCHPANILVLPSGRVGLIDLERAAWMPFYFDALYMLRMNNAIGNQLRAHYFQGAFDPQLDALWRAAGRSFCPDLRLEYLLAVAMAHTLRDQFRHDPPAKRARKLEKPTRALRPWCASATPSRAHGDGNACASS